MKKTLVLMTMAVLAMGLTACKDEKKTESTQTSETPDGTSTESKTTATTTTEDNGDKSTDVKTEKTVDPAGLGNKETTTDKATVKEETK